MPSVNKVIAIGNLGKDPELKYLASGDAVCNFSIGCNDQWKDKNGDKQERVEWINCTAFSRTAEVAGEYLKKGNPVYVEGRLRTRDYEKDGVKRYVTEVVVDRLQLLGGKPSGDTDRGRTKDSAPAKGKANTDDFEDDIPF